MGVNLWGAIHARLVFVPMMIAQDTECHIVYTASSAGITSGSGAGPYGVTKHGVVSLSETLSLQLAERGTKIHVSVLCPEYVNTPLWSSERNRPSEVRDLPGTIQQTADTMAEKARRRTNFDEGISPEQVADCVFDATRKNKFYIITHPDTLTGVKKRMESILLGHNPED